MDTLEARDLINSAILTGWRSYPGGLDEDALYFQGRKKDGPPDTVITWCRTEVKHLIGGSQSLSGEAGKALYTRPLTVTLQLFTPFNDGLTVNDNLSQYLVEIFQGKAFNSLWFRDVFSTEVGGRSNWYQTNIFASGEYTQLK